MTKAQIKTLVTEILDGFEMGDTIFDALLDVAQATRENARNWVILRTEDATQTLGSGNTYTTAKTIPSTFRKWYSYSPVVLVDSLGNKQAELQEIPLNKKHEYKDDPNKFYCDYANNYLYICGTFSQNLTIKQYFIAKDTLVSGSDSNEWTFPSEFHKILAFDIAVMWKLGIDYDVINNIQGDQNAMIANKLFMAMEEWDNELQLSSLNGQEY